MRLAISNPCFEYWILLHFKSTDRVFADCDEVIRELKKEFPAYAKNINLPDKHFLDVEAVAKLARQLHTQMIATHPIAEKEPPNPSTTVYELVEKLYSMRRL